MCACVCTSVCIHASMHPSMHVCVHVCVCVCIYGCLGVAQTHASERACVRARACVRTRVRACAVRTRFCRLSCARSSSVCARAPAAAHFLRNTALSFYTKILIFCIYNSNIYIFISGTRGTWPCHRRPPRTDPGAPSSCPQQCRKKHARSHIMNIIYSCI